MTSGLIEILIDDEAVVEMVGFNSRGDKPNIWPIRVPQGENNPKYIVVSKSSNEAGQSLTKDLPSLLDYPTYTVYMFAKNFRDTELINELVRLALDNKQSVTNAGVVFNRIWLFNDYDAYDNDSQMYCHVAIYKTEVVRSVS